MARKLEISVAPTCISSGHCRHAAPHVFGATPERKSFVLSNPVEETADVRDAFESCPVEAITARDADTGEDVFP